MVSPKELDTFSCLGSTVAEDAGIDPEMQTRTDNLSLEFGNLYHCNIGVEVPVV